MAYPQYKIIRKAAELEEIKERMALISDMNAAFHGNTKHVNNLEKTHQSIIGNIVLEEALTNAKPDPDWQTKLNRFKR
jgi:heme oxygenase